MAIFAENISPTVDSHPSGSSDLQTEDGREYKLMRRLFTLTDQVFDDERADVSYLPLRDVDAEEFQEHSPAEVVFASERVVDTRVQELPGRENWRRSEGALQKYSSG